MSEHKIETRTQRQRLWRRAFAFALIPVLGFLFISLVGTSGSARNVVGSDRVFLLVEVVVQEGQSRRASVIEKMSQDEYGEWIDSASFDPYRGRDVFVVDHHAWTEFGMWPNNDHVRGYWEVTGQIVDRSENLWEQQSEEFPAPVLAAINDLIAQDLLSKTDTPFGDRLTPADLDGGGPRLRASTRVPPPGGELLGQIAWAGIVVGVSWLMVFLFSTS